ncbi:MAG: GNAT family N-acetyltransferase [Rhizobiales bacterium]|nr:GNAT family N-acetyltransferase [Hyphomicrobiales bacterium]
MPTCPPGPFQIEAVTPQDLPAIERLNDIAFGPGRFARTAFRLREGMPAISPLCRIIRGAGNELIAAVKMTPITIGGRGGALLLGPIVVAPERKNQGYGLALMRAVEVAAREAGHRLIVLVGDPPYYARAGYGPVPVGQMEMPGPVDPSRLLALELEAGALADYRGAIASDRVRSGGAGGKPAI